MYNELIADLKEISNWIVATASTASFSHDELNALHYADKVRDGADLIEQQQALIERLKAEVPTWISVEERLPEHGVHVLAACFIKMFDGIGRYYVCDAFHTEHFTETCNYDDDIDMEYNEEEDEYYMPEGWWEVIKNWDDYSCVAIADHVTHWQPLPDAPGVEG